MTCKTCDIAARPREARNKAASNRITDPAEHNRHISGDRFKHLQCKVGECYCNIGRTADKFCGAGPHLLWSVIPPLHLHDQIMALPPPEFVEPSQEGGNPIP